MSNRTLSSLLASFYLFGMISCGIDRKASDNKLDTAVISNGLSGKSVSLLEEENFYNIKRVKEIQEAATEAQQLKSAENLKMALALADEKKYYESLSYFVQSISEYPMGEAYLGLGMSNLELEYYEDAIDAYHLAEWLNYEPLSDIYYHLATAYFSDPSDLDGKNRAKKFLKMAVANGYDDWAHFLGNARFGNYRYSEEFANLFYSGYEEVFSSRNQANFKLFSHLFPSVMLPFEVTTGRLNMTKPLERPYISKELSYLTRKNKPKRLNKNTYYEAMLWETDSYITLLWSKVLTPTKTNTFGPGANYFKLVTYELHTGKLIDQLLFADNTNPFFYTSGKIDENQLIKVTKYKSTWEKNPKIHGYEDNQIEFFDYHSSKTYSVNEGGLFEEASNGALFGEL